MAQKTEKKGKEQEVFLGVKGNAQASRPRLTSFCWLARGAHSLAHPPPAACLHSRHSRAVASLTCHPHNLPLRPDPAVPAVPAVQLLGMKGADMETDIWKIRVQLMKPVTWIPLIWGALCAWCIVGNSWHWCRCMLLTGGTFHSIHLQACCAALRPAAPSPGRLRTWPSRCCAW